MPELSSVRGRLASTRRPCWVCRRWIATYGEGRVTTHGPRQQRCPGSGNWPGNPWITVRTVGGVL